MSATCSSRECKLCRPSDASAIEESLADNGPQKSIAWFDGMTFGSMSDEYLVQSFDVLSERTSLESVHAENWIGEWNACKDELLARLAKARAVDEL